MRKSPIPVPRRIARAVPVEGLTSLSGRRVLAVGKSGPAFDCEGCRNERTAVVRVRDLDAVEHLVTVHCPDCSTPAVAR